jgi:membrane protease YdiL (CAAX protease family)
MQDEGPRWRHVAAFLGLAFGLTWLLDLGIFLRGGLETPGMLTLLQFQMLLPAFSAIVLGLWFFPESPLFHTRSAGRGRWFYYYFLLLTLIYALGAVGVWLAPAEGTVRLVSATAPLLLSFLGLVLLVGLRFSAGAEAMARVGLAWGRWRDWLLFSLGIIGFYVLQTVFNAAAGLGPSQLAPVIGAPPGMTEQMFLVLAAIQTVVLGPILGIVITFGEEYGWRGYLQTELVKLGRVRGVLLVGVIWGAWHWPIILMGFNYPDHPLLGVLLMTLYTTGLAVVLGYAVLRSGSVLLASYLHALNNQFVSFLVALGFKPFDTAFSFDIGIYGLLTLALVALLVLRDPIWQKRDRAVLAPQPA